MNTTNTNIAARHAARRLLAVIMTASLSAASASAQTFELTSATTDCGGGTSTSGDATVELTSSIGQGDAGVLAGGAFELSGGFLPVVASTTVVTGACCYAGACSDTQPGDCLPFVCSVAQQLPQTFAGCFGDADGNGVVNAGDRGFVSANIGQTDAVLVCSFDMDGNGVINAGDRGFVSANIGLCTPLPDWQDGSGLNHGAADTRFGSAVFAGVGTTCADPCP